MAHKHLSLVFTVLVVCLIGLEVVQCENLPWKSLTIKHREPRMMFEQANDDCDDDYIRNLDVHPFNVTDMMKLDRIGGPIVSPDEQLAVYTRRVWSPCRNQSSTSLWGVHISTSSPSPFPVTSAPYGVSDSSPVWAPDSASILFLSTRSGSSQIWQVAASGGTPVQVSNYPVDVNDILLSPDGSHIALSAAVYPGLTMQQTKERDDSIRADPTEAYTYDKLFVRHWDEWFDGHRNHIFLSTVTFSPATNKYTIGDLSDILGGLDSDAPTKPFGGSEEWSFSPHAKQFAFTRQHDETSSVAWNTNLDIYTVSIEHSTYGKPVCITCDNFAADTQPQHSPDGSAIAYLSQRVPGYESDRYRVKLYNITTKQTTELTESFDRSFQSVDWGTNNNYVYSSALEFARVKMFRISVQTGKVDRLVVNGSVGGLVPLADGSVVYQWNSFNEPNNVFIWHTDNTTTQLTFFNAQLLSLAKMSEPQEFWFQSGGDRVHGWILRPVVVPGVPHTAKTSVAYLIHGGPQGSWSSTWSYRWNPQIYAGHGYSCAMIDFHGSDGYGQNFTDSIQFDYGGQPFFDVTNSLSFITSRYSFVDGTYIGLGASYGGYMINWINSHTTAFRALVCHDGIFDLENFYYETEELFFPEHDQGGPPYNKTALQIYEKWNPARFVGNWKTPQLVIHGGLDYRIPDTHGLGAFTALQRQGIASKFVYFPKENHWVLKPANSVYWHTVVLSWVDQWALHRQPSK